MLKKTIVLSALIIAQFALVALSVSQIVAGVTPMEIGIHSACIMANIAFAIVNIVSITR